jgi:hypothetical protein
MSAFRRCATAPFSSSHASKRMSASFQSCFRKASIQDCFEHSTRQCLRIRHRSEGTGPLWETREAELVDLLRTDGILQCGRWSVRVVSLIFVACLIWLTSDSSHLLLSSPHPSFRCQHSSSMNSCYRGGTNAPVSCCCAIAVTARWPRRPNKREVVGRWRPSSNPAHREHDSNVTVGGILLSAPTVRLLRPGLAGSASGLSGSVGNLTSGFARVSRECSSVAVT